MVTGVTKLPWPKGRALSRSVHSSDILGGPILYSRGYSLTDSSRIAMGGKGLNMFLNVILSSKLFLNF
jgi:hypothetical protein